ncbi:MAG: tRNA pseudouridine(55) synthase TruB [Malacoplasma sp.]|nr:tRNA pseudouridine(55) synthase TruB [Malacoplasma sp.]
MFIKNTNLDLSNQIILINKPKFFTSNDVIQIIKKAYKIKKIGHSGTLDPYACGLLLVATDSKTKMLNQLLLEDKEYVAKIQFNYQTESYDGETNVVKQTFFKVNLFNLKNQIKKLNNVILYQTPPIYSAIKINGKKLYEYARSRQNVNINPKKVFINEAKLLHFDYNLQIATIQLNVSKGFYVRSFANDLGITLNNLGYLKELTRTKIGQFKLKNAHQFFDLVTKV